MSYNEPAPIDLPDGFVSKQIAPDYLSEQDLEAISGGSYGSLGAIASIVSPALVIFTGLQPQVLASPSISKSCISFPPVTERGSPERTAGAGTRYHIDLPSEFEPQNILL